MKYDVIHFTYSILFHESISIYAAIHSQIMKFMCIFIMCINILYGNFQIKGNKSEKVEKERTKSTIKNTK